MCAVLARLACPASFQAQRSRAVLQAESSKDSGAKQWTLEDGSQRDSRALLINPMLASAGSRAMSGPKGLLATRSLLSERSRTTAYLGFKDNYERWPWTRASCIIAAKQLPCDDD